MNLCSRRSFLHRASVAALWSPFAQPFVGDSDLLSQSSAPHVPFSAAPDDRVAVSSYPFREFIAGRHGERSADPAKMSIKDFAGHVLAKFNVRKVEPWSEHFLSAEPAYLDEIREAAARVGSGFANIAADQEASFYSQDASERQRAIQFGKAWIDVAARLGSPSVRLNVVAARNAKPDSTLVAEGLKPLAQHAAAKNVAVHLENDNPVSEDPFFIVSVVDRVGNSWIRALPDFGNSLAALPQEEAYRGLDQMFARAYAISHVKDTTTTPANVVVQVDMARIFALAKKHNYKGVFSMEWETAGDVYAGTASLIATTLKNLS
jgi:sugar phosphate isomerase/epimerase